MESTSLKKSCRVAGAACVAAGLISTWDVSPAQAADYTFSGEITPSFSLTSVYFLFTVGSCSGGGTYMQKIADTLPANVTTSFNVTFNSLADGLGGPEGFSVLGLYDPVNGGVSVGYDPGVAAQVLSFSPGPEWNGPFIPGPGSPGPSYGYIGASESDTATALQNGTVPFAVAGDPFPGGPSTDPLNPTAFTLVNFSGASPGGSGDVIQVVPEPGSLSLLAVGATALAGNWLRCRARG